jgi:hypothetical protein
MDVEEVGTAATVEGAPRSPPDDEPPDGASAAGAGESVLEGAPPEAAGRSAGCVARSPVGAVARSCDPSSVFEPWTIVETADVTAWVGRSPARPANAQRAMTARPA